MSKAPIERNLTIDNTTRVTRLMAKALEAVAADATSSHATSASAQQTVASVRGGFRCVCDSYFVSTHEEMLECKRCLNWCHASCMNVEIAHLRSIRPNFVCGFCTGEAKKKRSRDDDSSTIKAPCVKLTEFADRSPLNAEILKSALTRMHNYAFAKGYEVIYADHEHPGVISDSMVDNALACCASAIHSATFSESYPSYCINELRAPPHKYLQGCFMRCRSTRRIVSLVTSNGMDNYGNLRQTITQIRCHAKRSKVPLSEFSEQCMSINDVSSFVHICLIATHPTFRGRGLAKILIAIELLRWALRGRESVYLNMALDKKVEGNRLVCSVSPASRRLYDVFGFRDVYARKSDAATGSALDRWTSKEADMGRVLANINFVDTVVNIVNAMTSVDSHTS